MEDTNERVSTNIRVPKELWEWLRQWAFSHGVSVNSVVVDLIEDKHRRENN